MKNIVLAFAFLLSTVAFAQPQGQRQGRERFNPEELRARMDAYFTKKANLTAEEAKAVLPIFKELKDKQRELHMQMRKIRRETKEGSDYEKALLRIAELNKQAVSLESEYYKRMCKAVPAEKVFRIVKAENNFHRGMLGEFNGKKNAGKGHGPAHQGKGRKNCDKKPDCDKKPCEYKKDCDKKSCDKK